MNAFKKLSVLFISLIFLFDLGCSTGTSQVKVENTGSDSTKFKVTFIELGSVKCIPCQQMQPVMKSIEKNFKGSVKVVFHDVWTETGAPYAKQFGIEAIPTQVFLDETGKEYYRHVGFFPEEELVKILTMKGAKAN
jgi:thioredoxin 1